MQKALGEQALDEVSTVLAKKHRNRTATAEDANGVETGTGILMVSKGDSERKKRSDNNVWVWIVVFRLASVYASSNFLRISSYNFDTIHKIFH